MYDSGDVVADVTAGLRGWSADMLKYGGVMSCLGLVSILGLRVRLNMKNRARRMVAITNIVRAEGSKAEVYGSSGLLDGSKSGGEGDVGSMSSGPGGLGRSTGIIKAR